MRWHADAPLPRFCRYATANELPLSLPPAICRRPYRRFDDYADCRYFRRLIFFIFSQPPDADAAGVLRRRHAIIC